MLEKINYTDKSTKNYDQRNMKYDTTISKIKLQSS